LYARKQNPQFNSFAVNNNPDPWANAAYFFVEPKNYWSAEQSNAFYGRLKIDMQKEFAPPILYDNRFVAHSIPVSNGSQNYQWIPSNRSKQSFGEQMAGTVVRSLLGIKQDNSNGHYSSSGIKY
jgi:hypothetical protein